MKYSDFFALILLKKTVFTCNEVFFMNYILLVRLLFTIDFFTSLLLYTLAVSRLVRMCLAQPGYGIGLLPPVYCRSKPQINILLNSISVVFSLKYISCTFLLLKKNSSNTFTSVKFSVSTLTST